MAILSGSLSFSRFRVVGGSPKRLDDNFLEKLRERRIGQQRVMRANHEEVGWIGGRHLLDIEFDIEKNVLLECAHLGMRIDVSKVPPQLLRAYTQMEIDSQYRNANGNGNGHDRSRIRRQARESARDRAEQEIKEGRFRSQRAFPMLLDTREDVLYAGVTSPSVLERLYPLFKDTFGKRLEPMSAGERAQAWAEANGVSRKLENLHPAGFKSNGNGNGNGNGHGVYWTKDPAMPDFLGNEMLLWLWYHLSEKSDTLQLADDSQASVVIVKELLLECPRAETGKEMITCDGPTQLPESRRAIESGKLPRKAGLIISRQGEQYEFTLQAETFNVTAAKLPAVEVGENGNGNGNGHVRAEERIEQIRHLAETVDMLFAAFLQNRFSAEWHAQEQEICAWLRSCR